MGTLKRVLVRNASTLCIGCHGAPGVARSAIGKGLYPNPPDLEKIANKLNPKEIFWTVSNGLKMTGMPAFSLTHDEASLWGVTALVKKLPVISPGEIPKSHLQKELEGKSPSH